MFKRLPRLTTAQFIILATIAIALYFLVSGAFNGLRTHQLRQEASRLEADIHDLDRRYERLDALRGYLNSDEYVESVAREQLGLVRKGETGIVVISTVPAPTPVPGSDAPTYWWDILIR